MNSKYLINPTDSEKAYEKMSEKELMSFLSKTFKETCIDTKYNPQIRSGSFLKSFPQSMEQAKPFKSVKSLMQQVELNPQDFVYKLSYPKEDWRTKKLCFEFQFGKITATDNHSIWASNFENKFFIDTSNIGLYNKIISDLDDLDCHYIEMRKGENEL